MASEVRNCPRDGIRNFRWRAAAAARPTKKTDPALIIRRAMILRELPCTRERQREGGQERGKGGQMVNACFSFLSGFGYFPRQFKSLLASCCSQTQTLEKPRISEKSADRRTTNAMIRRFFGNSCFSCVLCKVRD